MKIAKKIKGMSVMAMAAITLTAAVSSCSKDKGATPAQNTTQTKKGLGMKVSAVSAAGAITVTVTGYDAKQHADVKIQASSDDFTSTVHTIEKAVTANDSFLLENLDKTKSYKVRLSYTIPGGGTGQNPLTTESIEVNRQTATAVITSISGVSNEEGKVVLTISGTNLEQLALEKAGIQSKVKGAIGFVALSNDVTVTSLGVTADQDGDGTTSREVTISNLPKGQEFLFKIGEIESTSILVNGDKVDLTLNEQE